MRGKCVNEPLEGRKFTLYALEYDFATHTPQRLGGIRGFACSPGFGLLALGKMVKCKLAIYLLLRQQIYCPVSTELELAFFAQKRQFVFQTEKT